MVVVGTVGGCVVVVALAAGGAAGVVPFVAPPLSVPGVVFVVFAAGVVGAVLLVGAVVPWPGSVGGAVGAVVFTATVPALQVEQTSATPQHCSELAQTPPMQQPLAQKEQLEPEQGLPSAAVGVAAGQAVALAPKQTEASAQAPAMQQPERQAAQLLAMHTAPRAAGAWQAGEVACLAKSFL